MVHSTRTAIVKLGTSTAQLRQDRPGLRMTIGVGGDPAMAWALVLWVGIVRGSFDVFARATVYLQLLDDGGSVLVGLGLATQVAGEGLALGKGVEDGLLDSVGVLVEAHVPQHHDGAEEQRSGVGEALAGNVGGGAVDSLEDGALVADVARGSETKTTDQAGAHVGQNVAVQVGHDQDLVVVGVGVGDHLQARVVEKLGVELDVREVLGDLATDVEEETVGHLHDGGLVNDADLLATDGLGVLESEAKNALAGLAGDELDALNNAINDDVLNARVLALGVLSDQDGVDVIVRGLEAGDGTARSQIGKEVEGTAQSQIERDVALANRGLDSARGSASCRRAAIRAGAGCLQPGGP